MYQIHVQVHEYLGGVSIRAAISQVTEDGQVQTLATVPEKWYEPLSEGDDTLLECFDALRRWAVQILDPRRVASGVSREIL